MNDLRLYPLPPTPPPLRVRSKSHRTIVPSEKIQEVETNVSPAFSSGIFSISKCYEGSLPAVAAATKREHPEPVKDAEMDEITSAVSGPSVLR